jgi:hypothetical protein
MAPEIETSGEGYLWRSLASAAAPFYFRSRVRALLGLPASGGVEMNFPQPLPFGGFAYAIQRFPGLVEIPGESIGTARSTNQASQTFLSNLASAPPRARARSEAPSRIVTRPASTGELSQLGPSVGAKESQPSARTESRTSMTVEPPLETSASQRLTAEAPSPPPAPRPAERQAAIVADLSIPGRNPMLPALRRDLRRGETLKGGGSADLSSMRAHTAGSAGSDGEASAGAAIASSGSTSKPGFEMPAPKHPLASPPGRPGVSTSFGVAAPPPTAIKQTRPGAAEGAQVSKVHPPGVSTVPTQPLLAKSLPHRNMPETATAPPRTEPRRPGPHRKFAETTREDPQEMPVSRQASVAPEPTPVVIVNQNPETSAAAFWERRYLSHLHLRIRR